MEIKIILLITILFYTVIVSQSIAYIISLRNVQENMTAPEYIAFRKQTDKNFRSKYPFVLYASLGFNLVLVILCIISLLCPLLICSAIAFTALLLDAIIAIKSNLPINDIINTWTPEKHPENWMDYRTAWLYIFRQRQLINIAGYISLVSGAIFT